MATTFSPAALPSNAAEIMLEAELRGRIDGEVRFDRVSRMLYSTDASNYQIEPVGVVIPRHNDDAHAAIELAAKHGISILPRGGGSALAGQTVGHSLVIDFSKYMANVLDLNIEERAVRVQPGINLDLLNTGLKKHGLMFGPDPSSGNRATIGGVIGNNSSGAHSILYGMTSDHVRQAVVILPDGSRITLDPSAVDRAGQDDPTGRLMAKLLAFQEKHSPIIARDFPRHWRRATGYSLDQFLKPELNPARLVVSSEGTLATTLEATLELVPTPTKTALAILQFEDLVEAMATTTTILETNPSAIELMDRMLIELTRQQPGFASQIAYIRGSPEAVLAVEFYGETDEQLRDQLDKLEWHLRANSMLPREEMIRATDATQQADVWSVRKAGLGLLMSIKGDAKPIPGIEDVSVPVEHLAEYVAEIKQLCADYGTVAAYYAHASAGCLHIRPLINLKAADGVQAMDEITRAAAEMARRFSGVMSGEHGDGLQRSELNEKIFGPELYAAMREFKDIFDPHGIMNPGKVVDAPPMVESLRFGAEYATADITTHLDFSREGGFARAIEMCNGAGVCRKIGAGTMCPSYMATRDEMDTTRARANALRNALAGRMFMPEEMTSPQVYDVLDLCLSCKACKTECPSSVDMAKIKTEFLAQYHDAHGVDHRTRMFGAVHQSSKLASRLPALANLTLGSRAGRAALSKMGVHPERHMSRFADETFEAWWKRHKQHREAERARRVTRGQAVYFHDTFATYNYPRVGRAVVRLLEAAGFEVVVETRRSCCGRPMYSKGLVDAARKLARANVKVLAPYARKGVPVVGSEPSCVLMFRDEYIDLLPGDDDAAVVGANSFMIDEFLQRLAASDGVGIEWRAEGRDVLFHGHCHQKALIGMAPSMAVLKRAGLNAFDSGAGCCGMAGSFGYETEHYDVSRKVGEERLFPRVRNASTETTIAVAGVSCRQQIEHFTDRTVTHIAEVLAEQVKPGHVWTPSA
ncbi:MAG TPA: FAD-linked oxidase C-terminal domain-containing protein [Thermomicrobiales bacterium]|nr:FAD-linked oxidase C-terminal domain-containing protein [Thermomicrobiales bacterium]